MTVIEPTHRCFDDALEYIEQRVLEDDVDIDTLLLVHGIARIPDDQPRAGHRFVHAWVEEAGKVWDCGVLDGQRVYFQVEQAEYYAHLRVERVTKYDGHAIWTHNHLTGHYGPWDPEYRALVEAAR